MKATRQFTKEYNQRLVLKTFYENEEISRADVARITGLTKATVSELVNDLVEDGLVSESRYAEASVGKPALLLQVERNGRHLICVDLANQEFRGAVVNMRGELLHTVTLSRDGKVGQPAIDLVYALVDALIEKADHPILGIGIGTPGLIDTTHGFVQYAVNMEWRNVPLGEMLNARYHLPVHIANDSQIAALAEAQFGACGPDTTQEKSRTRGVLEPGVQVVTTTRRSQLKASKGGYGLHQLSVTAVVKKQEVRTYHNNRSRMLVMHPSHG